MLIRTFQKSPGWLPPEGIHSFGLEGEGDGRCEGLGALCGDLLALYSGCGVRLVHFGRADGIAEILQNADCVKKALYTRLRRLSTWRSDFHETALPLMEVNHPERVVWRWCSSAVTDVSQMNDLFFSSAVLKRRP